MGNSSSRSNAARIGPVNPREQNTELFTAPQMQLELRPVSVSEYDRQWEALRRLLAAAVDDVTLKEAAFALDTKPSVLLDCLAGRDHHHFRASWLVYLVARARTSELAEFFAGLRGLEVRTAKVATPEEKLAALQEALDESLSPDMRAVIVERARKKAREGGR